MPIFEASIHEINYRTGKCSLLARGATAGDGDIISGVPIPHTAGLDDTGIFIKWKVGTKVVATTSDNSSNSVPKILATIPSDFLYEDSGKRIPQDAPPKTVRYPHIEHDDVDPNTPEIIMYGGVGSKFQILPGGDMHMTTNKNMGMILVGGLGQGTLYSSSGNMYTNSNAHRSWSGAVKRMRADFKDAYMAPSPRENRLLVDSLIHKGGAMGGSRDIAMFTGSSAWHVAGGGSPSSSFNKNRNARRAESVTKYYEFTTDSMFSGFDDEADRIMGAIAINDVNDKRTRDRIHGNLLHMPERELVEVVVGNLIDINGSALDINFGKIVAGDPGDKFPQQGNLDSIKENIFYTEKITRRGVGYHFQLSTNSSSIMPSQSQSNFLFDIDKEGIMKLNVPKSSSTGNVPFAANTSYLSDGDIPIVSTKNPSKLEAIPVTLRKEDGTVQYPTGSEYIRNTGVEYVNIGESKYFPYSDASSDRERINCTAHHNMYSIGERLIANTIQSVNVGYVDATRLAGLPAEMGSKPFEIPNDGSVDVHEMMSCVNVSPGIPAMNPGSKDSTLIVAGRDQQSYKAFSNSFGVEKDGETLTAKGVGAGAEEGVVDSGGKSANINFEGAVDLSIGKDNYDQKSLVIDTESTVLAWLGKPTVPATGPTGDESDRSLIVQSDGSILINVGGTYSGDIAAKEDIKKGVAFNKGRLDIRVNVSDKGLVGATEGDALGGDFLISISEHGLVIAGMAKELPMVIRNHGELSMESATKLTLNGGPGGIDFVGPTGIVTKLKDIEKK
tara:strand:+ start:41403 stop:43751 length:2349 start_codon:yes stop_codon:yes gene_type:complete